MYYSAQQEPAYMDARAHGDPREQYQQQRSTNYGDQRPSGYDTREFSGRSNVMDDYGGDRQHRQQNTGSSTQRESRDVPKIDEQVYALADNRTKPAILEPPKLENYLSDVQDPKDAFRRWKSGLNNYLESYPRYKCFVDKTTKNAWTACRAEEHIRLYGDSDTVRQMLQDKWRRIFTAACQDLFCLVISLLPTQLGEAAEQGCKSRATGTYSTGLSFVDEQSGSYKEFALLMDWVTSHYHVTDSSRAMALLKRMHNYSLDLSLPVSVWFSSLESIQQEFAALYRRSWTEMYPESVTCMQIISMLPSAFKDEAKKLIRLPHLELNKAKTIHLLNSQQEMQNGNVRLASFSKAIPATTFVARGTPRYTKAATAAAAGETRSEKNPESSARWVNSEQRVETRTCNGCGIVGHIRANCKVNPYPQHSNAHNVFEANDDEHLYSTVAHSDDDESSPQSDADAVEFEEAVIDEKEGLCVTEALDSNVHSVITSSHLGVQRVMALIDTGAAIHVTGCLQILRDVVPAKNCRVTGVGGNREATHTGNILVPGINLLLVGVRYVPGYDRTLISMGKLQDAGIEMTTDKKRLILHTSELMTRFNGPPSTWTTATPGIILIANKDSQGLFETFIGEYEERGSGPSTSDQLMTKETAARYEKYHQQGVTVAQRNKEIAEHQKTAEASLKRHNQQKEKTRREAEKQEERAKRESTRRNRSRSGSRTRHPSSGRTPADRASTPRISSKARSQHSSTSSQDEKSEDHEHSRRREGVNRSSMGSSPASPQASRSRQTDHATDQKEQKESTGTHGNITGAGAGHGSSSSSISNRSHSLVPSVELIPASVKPRRQVSFGGGIPRKAASASHAQDQDNNVRSSANSRSVKGSDAAIVVSYGEDNIPCSAVVLTCTDVKEASEPTDDPELPPTAQQLHRRFAHVGPETLREASRLYDLNIDEEELRNISCGGRKANCEVCILTRVGSQLNIGRKSAHRISTASAPLDVLHADLLDRTTVIGPDGQKYLAPAITGHLYTLVVVDEYSRYTWAILLRHKSDCDTKLIELITLAERQTGRKLKRLHSDRGGEFMTKVMDVYAAKEGINLTYAPTGISEYNAIAERMNQTLIKSVRSMLEESGAPQELWGFAIQYSALIHNVLPIPAHDDMIPLVMYMKHRSTIQEEAKRHLNKLRKFGCDVYVHIEKSDRGKFESVKERGVNLGWDETKATYHVLLPHKKKVIETRDVAFMENKCQHIEDALAWIKEWSEQQAGELANQSNAEVENILADRHAGKLKEFLVKWTGYYWPTWVIEKNLDNCEDKLREFRQRQLAPSSSKRRPRASKDQQEAHAVYEEGIALPADAAEACAASDATPVTPSSVKPGLDYVEPKNYKAGLADPHRAEWIVAIIEELDAMREQGVFELVFAVPRGRKLIGSTWVFKAKRDVNNELSRYRARLVGLGYEQEKEIDYFATYAPTVRVKSTKLMMALAALYDLEMKQIDFKTAFLNANLDVEIYMEIPKGWYLGADSVSNTAVALKIKKALYGLKQSPHEWNKEVDGFLQSIGYQASPLDECLYIKRFPLDANYKHADPVLRTVYLTLFVDDMLAVYHKDLEAVWLADKELIKAKYKITDEGNCQWIYNMSVVRDRERRTLSISQEPYIEKLLETHGLGGEVKDAETPFQYSDVTQITDDTPADELLPLSKADASIYRSKVGGLLYAANITRFDLAFIVGVLARYLASPLQRHMKAVNRVLRYLVGTKKKMLTFDYSYVTAASSSTATVKIPARIVLFSDSNWASEAVDRKSTSGWVSTLNGSVIAWQSKKQSTIAKSSTEAEYYAVGEAACEALFMRQWVERHIYDASCPTMTILCDNQGAQAMSTHATNHNNTKHIDIRHHFIRHHTASGAIIVSFIRTEQQLADIFTKAVGVNILHSLCKAIWSGNCSKFVKPTLLTS